MSDEKREREMSEPIDRSGSQSKPVNNKITNKVNQ